MKVTRIDGLSDRKRSGIFEHVFSNKDREVAGVLVGQYFDDGTLWVVDHIPAEAADEQVAAVTFTHESWDRILRIKDIDFADLEIVGWYHSHPGYGLFLSGDDMFLHRNFFPAWWQIAYVIDPVNKEGGIFVWSDSEMEMFDRHAASSEGAGLAGLGSLAGEAFPIEAVRERIPKGVRSSGLLGPVFILGLAIVLVALLGLLVLGSGGASDEAATVVPTDQEKVKGQPKEGPVEVVNQFPRNQGKQQEYVPDLPAPPSPSSKGSARPDPSQASSGSSPSSGGQAAPNQGGVSP